MYADPIQNKHADQAGRFLRPAITRHNTRDGPLSGFFPRLSRHFEPVRRAETIERAGNDRKATKGAIMLAIRHGTPDSEPQYRTTSHARFAACGAALISCLPVSP